MFPRLPTPVLRLKKRGTCLHPVRRTGPRTGQNLRTQPNPFSCYAPDSGRGGRSPHAFPSANSHTNLKGNLRLVLTSQSEAINRGVGRK